MIGIMTSGIGSTLGNVLGGILQDTIGLNALFTFVYLMTALGAVIIFICKFVWEKSPELQAETGNKRK